MEETDRIAAGIMIRVVVLSFPGVKQGPDESENTIIVRGNSPLAFCGRLEGIDVPNPNHFVLIGGATGGINVFSAQLLSRSDFSTGGLAAEYGNSDCRLPSIYILDLAILKNRAPVYGIDRT